MNKRSYLDQLNTGRQRRSGSSIDDLGRTLDAIGSRLDQSLSNAQPRAPLRRDERSRAERLAADAYHDDLMGSRRRSYGHESVGDLARSIESARRQEQSVASMSQIASELQSMRDELRAQMNMGLQREFKTLRTDIERLYGAAASGLQGVDLTGELERLSDAIGSLAARSDDRSVALLRDELDHVKSAISQLAREDTMLSVERHWRDFDRRFGEFEERLSSGHHGGGSDPAIAALQGRLEEIADAVNNLPESLSLRHLDDKVRTLAGAIDRFAGAKVDGAGAFQQIEERLDEISRAIVASSVGGQGIGASIDQFERIEARISSLARQIEDLANDRPTGELIDRINVLSQRVDELGRRSHFPEQAMDRLAQQLDEIAGKLGAGGSAPDGDLMVRGLESRFESLAEALQRQQGDADRRGIAIFRELESKLNDLAVRLDEPAAGNDGAIMGAIDARFEELTRRFDRSATGADAEAIRGLEDRLENISTRLEQSSRQASGIDADVIRSLESQVAGLSSHLSRPGSALPDFEDIGPRLAQIERSVAGNRDAILESARAVAEQTIRQIGAGRDESPAVAALAGDLKALDNLARKADERNSRTFEAIHDTLLKIVDRLGTLESGEPPAKRTIETAPPLAPTMASEPIADAPLAPEPAAPARRSPAQAAAAAATAALADAVPATERVATDGKRSMLDGLTRAFSGRRKEVKDAKLAGDAPMPDAAPQIDIDDAIDPKAANRPLEPGSGTPDLAAIMRRVRDERGQSKADDMDAARSDFIAAARRAAQAAAAEAETRKKGGDGASKKSGGGLGSILQRHRKSLLVAVGGIVLALAAMQLGRAFFADSNHVASVKSSPSEIMSQVEPAAATETVKTEAKSEEAAVRAAGPVRDATPAAAETAATDPEEDAAQGVPEEIQDAGQTAASPQSEAEVSAEPKAEAEPAAPAPQTAAAVSVPVDAGPVPLREAAASGDAKAMFEIGSRYAEGRGGKQNLTEAAKWYERAADAGLAPAQYRIGNFYEKGTGVERDLKKAKTWYQMAAEQGNASAMHNLAVLYAMGADGTTDNESAGRWFIKAAELGVKDSQFNLGILSAKGIGVPQSLEESYKWFALVAKAGDKDAAQKRDEVANALRPEQLEKARATAELWRPKDINPEANDVAIPDGWREADAKTASVDMKKAVRNIQLILNKNGYDAGGADGVMGEKTKAAIISFQRDNGLDPTGEVNEELVGVLLKKK